ncbi:MAG: response regulator transcription factor [Muribaculaceae bacterium]
MSNFAKLDSMLREQAPIADGKETSVYDYARAMAAIEGVIAVVSDLRNRTSRIYYGDFARIIGIEPGCCDENSIWEKKILSLMTQQEREAKFIAELRFLHYVKRLGRRRRHCYLMTKIRFNDGKSASRDILHRLYYIYDADSESVSHAICLYGPMSFDFKGRSVAVDTLTGIAEELDASAEETILSGRERQVLALIDKGMKSREIAAALSISVHTVSRHRQEILARLQVKNSIEACRLAKTMELI